MIRGNGNNNGKYTFVNIHDIHHSYAEKHFAKETGNFLLRSVKKNS